MYCTIHWIEIYLTSKKHNPAFEQTVPGIQQAIILGPIYVPQNCAEGTMLLQKCVSNILCISFSQISSRMSKTLIPYSFNKKNSNKPFYTFWWPFLAENILFTTLLVKYTQCISQKASERPLRWQTSCPAQPSNAK